MTIFWLCVLSLGYQSFAQDKIWDDGKAEVSHYAAQEKREDHERTFVISAVLVKETLDATQMVKSDEPAKLATPLEVIKFNWILSVPTGMATHQQMASMFFRRDNLQLVKYSFAHHEWCGNTFKLFQRDGNKMQFEAFTYWDGWAHVEDEIRTGTDTFFYDELPVRLRNFDLSAQKTMEIALIDSQTSARGPMPQPLPATLVFAGTTEDGYAVQLQHHRGMDLIVFSKETNIMKLWKRWNGSWCKLLTTQRVAYWEKNADADRAMLPRLGK